MLSVDTVFLECVLGLFGGIFASLQAGGLFDVIIRHSPTRIIRAVSDDSGKPEFFPQWRFFGWHYAWKNTGYEFYSPVSFKELDDAVDYIMSMGRDRKHPVNIQVVWDGKLQG